MFEAYDTINFGEYMKKVRNSLNLTQSNVVEACKINVETLRRLEKGTVIPKYETLEYLSTVYKMDVLSLFSIHRSSELMYNFYNYIDDIIIKFNLDKLLDIENEFLNLIDNKKMNTLINYKDIHQLQLITKGIKEFNEKNFETCIETFLKAMSISNKKFDLKNYKKLKFTLLEARIILLIALGLSEVNKHSDANEMLKLVLKQLNNSNTLTTNYNELIIKIYANLSYNSHSLNRDKDALFYADEGINFCKKNKSMYCLFSLYYRRGAAKYHLGQTNYQKDFSYSIILLEIEGNKKLITIYKDITLKNYNFKI